MTTDLGVGGDWSWIQDGGHSLSPFLPPPTLKCKGSLQSHLAEPGLTFPSPLSRLHLHPTPPHSTPPLAQQVFFLTPRGAQVHPPRCGWGEGRAPAPTVTSLFGEGRRVWGEASAQMPAHTLTLTPGKVTAEEA